MTGDFNEEPNGHAIKLMQTEFSYCRPQGSYFTFHYWGSSQEIIDYIFINEK